MRHSEISCVRIEWLRNKRERIAAAQGYIPFAAHLFFPQFLSDRDKEQRALGMFMGMVYLDGCRECWVFGSTVSSGMDAEIERARKRGLILRYFTEACEEVTR